ncbi:flagellar motor protein MotB [Pseudooceanicola nanhaiensis]|uniref:flagellar motor protein MotB n=1 Tax=Pseudooceanicola nanhaiensis TaxID=375761 RepID=UPI001CD35174|nr:flagellar motor protein MotB [Pseudooceanicola nanhaiensis]MCA0920380.1 chemotaxis protein MotB [Pseudooceanicola nanhaiensis]
MSAQNKAAPIIIKKKKITGGDGHHGGAWKVAYADFVTAMMAFFLLMWLLNATTEKQRKGIADYFSPTIPLNRVSGGGDGAFGGESVFSEMTHPKQGTGATALRPTEEDAARGDSGLDREGRDGEEVDDRAFAEIEEALMGRGGESLVAPEILKHIVTRVTDEGLVIELFDLRDAPLFKGDTADPTVLLEDLAAMLVRVSGLVRNRIAVEGHVSARPVVLSSNPVWDLSTTRAIAMRHEMAGLGMDRDRVIRVTGHADREPSVRNPMAVRNNRLEIILLRSDRPRE